MERLTFAQEALATKEDAQALGPFGVMKPSLKTKCAWTPFEGKKVTGRILRVVLRGKTVYDGEKIIGDPVGNLIFPT